MDAAGQFPDPQFFEIYYINFDFLFPAISTNAGVGGNLDDMNRLLNGGRAIFFLNISNKQYGPWRIRRHMRRGRSSPAAMIDTNSTAATTQQIGTNGFPDGGMWIGGMIVIPPKLNFTIITQFQAAQTIATTPLNIRCSLVGNAPPPGAVIHGRLTMPRYPITPKSRVDLLNIATPDTANQPECLPWELWDTQNFVNTTTLNLSYFVAVNADKTLSNMEAAAALPDPQFFEIWFVTVDYLFPTMTSAAAVTGNANDVHILQKSLRGSLSLSISNKTVGTFPLNAVHSVGGPMGLDSGVIATSQQSANNGVQDGGLWTAGQIILPPKVNFTVAISFAATGTLATNNLPIQVGLIGVLHRRVL